MIITMEVEQALSNVRHIGGCIAARDTLSNALGGSALLAKHELRAIGLGCGDDHVATRLEALLREATTH